jgi:hypothetical protein
MQETENPRGGAGLKGINYVWNLPTTTEVVKREFIFGGARWL